MTDASGALLFYVRQKAFKLKESVTVFRDAEQTQPLYRIAADRVLDISAQYRIDEDGGAPIGVLQRHGMRSLWRAHYEVHRGGAPALLIREENPWVKLLDGLLGEIPILGLFTGYVLHPAYRLTRAAGGGTLLRAVKQPALFESRYLIERPQELGPADQTLAVLAFLMMLLLERSRG
ncbi:MAG TPA: hypothetical protein VFV05_11310 [Methylomirabilota bacterium]|nr:hypothetical protein [Methylomirabilota bacterium]